MKKIKINDSNNNENHEISQKQLNKGNPQINILNPTKSMAEEWFRTWLVSPTSQGHKHDPASPFAGEAEEPSAPLNRLDAEVESEGKTLMEQGSTSGDGSDTYLLDRNRCLTAALWEGISLDINT